MSHLLATLAVTRYSTQDMLSVFVLKDGTIISMTRDYDSTELLSPIIDRLSLSGTILRESEDSSMVLHALLDLSEAFLVDLCQWLISSSRRLWVCPFWQGLDWIKVTDVLDIGDSFEREITILEGKVLVNPDTDAVRQLHMLSAQLSLLRRTLIPLQAGRTSFRCIYQLTFEIVVYTLMYSDNLKAASVSRIGSSIGQPLEHAVAQARHSVYPSTGVHVLEENSGFLTQRAKVILPFRLCKGSLLMSQIYLSDVHDHLDEMLSICEQYSTTCDGLVSYSKSYFGFNCCLTLLVAFNMVNVRRSHVSRLYEYLFQFNMNSSMQGLSLITVIFLPASVLTGYFGKVVLLPAYVLTSSFGMNFHGFGALE